MLNIKYEKENLENRTSRFRKQQNKNTFIAHL